MTKQQFVNELSKLRPNSTFLSIIGYRNASAELANYQIVFHFSYQKSLQKSIEILEQYQPISQLESQAKLELLTSFHQSLIKLETCPLETVADKEVFSDFVREDGYTRFFDENGKLIDGIKMLDKTGELHLFGLIHHKKTLMPGIYSKDTRRELTKVKDQLRKSLPVGKFRQFKITPEQVEYIKVQHLSLLPPE